MIETQKQLWKYQFHTAVWYFVSFTKEEVLTGLNGTKRPSGWGQIPVEVRIGTTVWKTSLFPSKHRGYDLPIKTAVRRADHIDAGATVEITLSLG